MNKITPEAIISDIVHISNLLNSVPLKYEQYKQNGKYDRRTILKYLNKSAWQDVMLMIFNKSTNYNKAVQVICSNCKKSFSKHYSQISSPNNFCCKQCFYDSLKIPSVWGINKTRGTGPSKYKLFKCRFCSKDTIKRLSGVKNQQNIFCSVSCCSRYNQQNKNYGIRRSKLEQWLQTKLIDLYPTLEIHYNRKDAINSELDIYIPSLKLAFELNGIFHYEPIFGKEQLSKTQNNDKRKFAACIEANISLCIIDTSKQKYFKEQTCKPYFDIIKNIIDQHIQPII